MMVFMAGLVGWEERLQVYLAARVLNGFAGAERRLSAELSRSILPFGSTKTE